MADYRLEIASRAAQGVYFDFEHSSISVKESGMYHIYLT